MKRLFLFKNAVRSCMCALLAMCLAFFAVMALPVVSDQAVAADSRGPVIIRDTEIEHMLRSWSEPIIKAAGLEPQSVKFIIIQSPQLNAFVAGGQNIFLFTGLLQEAESAAEIVGVIAHEVGHISGGHLVRTRQALQNASYESLVGTIFGLGAALLTGESGFASVGALGAHSTAQRRFLAFSRVQESTADQAALRYFEQAEMSPEGLLGFMRTLENQELLPASQQVEYIRTHPLSRDRVAALEAGLKTSKHADVPYPASWKTDFERMQAKLTGFLSPGQVAWTYGDEDQSVPAKYARAIAAYRDNKTERALMRMDDLLHEEPENPFFHELKGQMLMDFSRVEEALPSYKRAVDMLPESGLIRVGYAHALVEAAGAEGKTEQGENLLKLAIVQLHRAARDEKRTSKIYRLLATAYGRLGQTSLASLYLAEEALMSGQVDYAKRQAQTAVKGLEEGSAPWIRAQDILKAVERAERDKDD